MRQVECWEDSQGKIHRNVKDAIRADEVIQKELSIKELMRPIGQYLKEHTHYKHRTLLYSVLQDMLKKDWTITSPTPNKTTSSAIRRP